METHTASEPTPSFKLDEKGRCCGRKPLVYKRPRLHYFCFKCSREYDQEGNQRSNFAWQWNGQAFEDKRINPKLQ